MELGLMILGELAIFQDRVQVAADLEITILSSQGMRYGMPAG